MSPLEILKKARALIAQPKCWGKCVYARAADGSIVHSSSDRAYCFCAEGALNRVAGGVNYSREAIHILGSVIEPYSSVAQWNDASDRTHVQVLAGFAAAIALAEKGAQS